MTPQEAENKTRKVLTRVWVVPPANAHGMIRWAVEHQREVTDRRALHFGALLATYPFFGSIAAAIGRQVHLDGAVDRKSLRTFARSTFGDREFIDAGTSKTLGTMRNLGVLEGPKEGPYRIGSRLLVPPSFSSWFLHALALTRQAESVRVAELSRAFELAAIDVELAASPYPMLDFHAENGSTVAVVRELGR